MKYVRVAQNDKNSWAQLVGEEAHLMSDAPYAGGKLTGKKVRLEECRLLAPAEPGKIVAVGKNYLDHISELHGDDELPKFPVLFIKPADCVIGPGESIILPSQEITRRVDYEAELALVIGRKLKNVSREQVMSEGNILGYTCLNDVTARDIQQIDGQWTRAKSFDTFAPVGPLITDEINPLDVEIKAVQNNIVRQKARTSLQMWDVYELVSFISQMMTLNPGDIVTTGTPAGIGQLNNDDKISIIIEGIGELNNIVIN